MKKKNIFINIIFIILLEVFPPRKFIQNMEKATLLFATTTKKCLTIKKRWPKMDLPTKM